MSDSDEYQKQLDRLSKLEEDVNGAEDESSIIPNGSLKLIKTEEVSQENVSPPKSDEENTSLSQSDQETTTTLPPLKQDTEVKDTDSKDTEVKDTDSKDTDSKDTDSKDTEVKDTDSKDTEVKNTDSKDTDTKETDPVSKQNDSPASDDTDSDSSTYYKKKNGFYNKRVTRNATGSLPKETKTLLMETTEIFNPSKSKKRPNARPGFYNVLAPECTSCGSDVILRPFQRRMLVHPYLKTAVCRQCHEFYHSDTFGIDEEGSQIYCIWCGEGGELIYCDKCEKAFCTDCIKRNFGKKVKEEILAKSKWECLICIPEMTTELRKVSQMIVKYQNLCIKDPYLIDKFEHEVTKAELQKEDYQGLVSTRIKERNTAKLLSSSQQKEESQLESENGEQSEESDNKGEDVSGKASSGSEYSASKKADSKPKQKRSSKERVNGNSKESDSDDSSDIDDAEFLKCIRKKAKDRQDNNTGHSKKPEDKSASLKETEIKKTNKNEDTSSDDSLFDTGNSKIKAKHIRKQLDSSDGDDEEPSDDNDELVQKYRNKLSKYKEASDKESVHSNYSEVSSDESSEAKSNSESSDSSKEGESGSEVEDKKDKGKDDENQENDKKGKSKVKKKKAAKSGDENSEGDDKKRKKKGKRKRKKKQSSESETDDDDDDEDENGKKSKSKRGKRKKIRKIMGLNQLQKETVAAQEAEDKRRSHLKEKSLPSQQGKILNFILEDLRKEKYRGKPPTIDDEEKGKVIEVHKHLKKRLKPHQLDGIQFMYDCCIESVEKCKNGSPGSGAILAHCMGLGKTFQVITFLTTVLNYHYIFGFKRALVVCPLNTILNWKAEFEKWVKDIDDAPEVSVLTDSIHNNEKRAEIVENWFETSGVLIMGYSLFRLLSTGSNIRKKHLKERFMKYLVDPGPDIVICDEGHVIKNEKTGISRSLNSLKTKRRVILTGTPLQNNLVEYHCMVSFVKPNLLGTTKEFKNMYENPINNGQCADATDFDMKLMKERSHILYEQLSACVQRRDYHVLKEFLPLKFEYVLSIKLSDLQVKLYTKYLDKAKASGGMMSKLFECYQTLKKVWTHPWLLEIDALKNEKDSIEDFVTDKETSEESWEASSDDSDFRPNKKKKKNKNGEDEEEDKKDPEENKEANPQNTTSAPDPTMVSAIADTIIPNSGGVDYNWFKGEMTDKDEKMLEHSGKLLVTLEILDKASQKGDKVLLFSQSLLALDFLETSINRVGWLKGRDYFRMDGSTKTAHRQSFQKQFNDKSNKQCRLFLISTKAGGLGINLVSANRIILFDMSWNPSDDTQSLFRAYRYGQQKNVYVYRLVARGTMEEKIYDRQVYKESLSSRVVDEKQITRYFSANDLQNLFAFDPSAQTCTTSVLANHNPPADDVLASILVDLDPPLVLEYHEHDSLLEHRPEQQLTEEERKAAWANFKMDKERRNVVNAPTGQQSVFQRLAAHTQAYSGPIITPIYSNQQELILGGFTNEQIVSIQHQLEPVVQSGRLHVKALGGGQLHIEGLGPEQQQVFINSIKEQQAQQIHAAQMARVLPQQHLINQLAPAERALFQQRLALLVQQQQQAQQLAQHQQAAAAQQPAVPQPQAPKPLTINSANSSAAPIPVPDSPAR